jgi:hypothetical protein
VVDEEDLLDKLEEGVGTEALCQQATDALTAQAPGDQVRERGVFSQFIG